MSGRGLRPGVNGVRFAPGEEFPLPAKNPLSDLALIAARDIGLAENPIGSNRGRDIQKYFEADNLVIDGKTDGYPWCAAAVSYWFQLFLKGHPEFSMTNAPRIARAFDFDEKWGPANGCLIFRPNQQLHLIQAGDIIIWDFSHASIAQSANRSSVTTTDANSNDEGKREGFEVCCLTRSLERVRNVVRPLPNAARA